ncbi:thioredoxin [Hydra vulgaris]|uniref:thioredoxin n=1 Tax=Hydra vulgaris TaxID=6087 RepID=UPI0001924A88|nr:thioredoxin [Hydra vulgaris]
MVLKVENKSMFDAIIKDNQRVAVDFTASWCGPCQYIGPKFEDFADKFKSIKFIKVDVDENEETASANEIRAMPTFKFFKDGKEFGKGFAGADEEELENQLNALASA